MNKLFTKVVGIGLGLVLALGNGIAVANIGKDAVPAHALQQTAAKCDFTTKYSSHSSYKDSWDWQNSSSDSTWKINYGANNNKGWAYVKLGSKSADDKLTGCYIGSPLIDKEVTKVSVKVLSNTGSNTDKMGVASWSLGVYSDSSYSTERTTVDKSATTISITSGNTYDVVPVSGDSWTANSYYKLVFNLTNTSSTNGVLWIESVTIYYEEQTSNPSVSFTTPTDVVAAGSTVTNAAAGENLSGASISYSSGNTSIATVNASTGEVTGVAIGSTTITATATVSGVDYSDDYTIYVTSSSTAYYTVAQARAAIDSGKGLTGQYVKGVVYQVDSFDTKYNSITYWISDDGSSSNPLEVYSGLGIGGAAFSSIDDISIGDIVVVTGELKKHNSTYEFNYNNQLVSQISIVSIAVKTAPTKTAYGYGEYFAPAGLVVTATYDNSPATTMDFAYDDLGSEFQFSPSTTTQLNDETSVSISLFGQSTSQAITVTARTITKVEVTGSMTNTTYVKNAAWDFTGLSLTVTYNTGNPAVHALSDLTVGTDFTVSKATADGTTSLTIGGTYQGTSITSKTIDNITYVSSATFTAGTDQGTSGGQNPDSMLKYGITVSGTSMATTTAQYRIYKDSTLTISSSGENIRKIEFTDAGDSGNPASNIALVDGQPGTYSDLTWLGSASSISFSPSAQARVSAIAVVTESGYVQVNGLAVDGHAATVGQHFSVDVVKKLTTQLNVTVTPDNVTESKEIAYTVDSGTGATVNATTGVVTGGSTVGDTAVIKATSVANSSYYVYFDVTVIDSRKVYDIDFSCTSSTTEFTQATWETAVSHSGEGAELTFGAISKVYPENNYIKFGASGTAGSLTLITPNSVEIDRVLIRAKTFVSVDTPDASSISVNSGTAQSVTEDWSYLIFDLDTPSDTVTIAASKASKCRFYVDDIIFISGDDAAAMGAYVYAATFMDALDSECAALDVTTGTWGTLNTAWTTMGNTNNEQTYFLSKTADENGHVIEHALSRYDYILSKYGTASYSNFMNRTVTPLSGSRIALDNALANSSTTVTIIVITILSLTALGGYFFIKKKKHQ